MNDVALRTEILALAATAANANESLTLNDFAQLDHAAVAPSAVRSIVSELIADGQLVRRGSRYFLAESV